MATFCVTETLEIVDLDDKLARFLEDADEGGITLFTMSYSDQNRAPIYLFACVSPEPFTGCSQKQIDGYFPAVDWKYWWGSELPIAKFFDVRSALQAIAQYREQLIARNPRLKVTVDTGKLCEPSDIGGVFQCVRQSQDGKLMVDATKEVVRLKRGDPVRLSSLCIGAGAVGYYREETIEGKFVFDFPGMPHTPYIYTLVDVRHLIEKVV